jgi:hypothetical protein
LSTAASSDSGGLPSRIVYLGVGIKDDHVKMLYVRKTIRGYARISEHLRSTVAWQIAGADAAPLHYQTAAGCDRVVYFNLAEATSGSSAEAAITLAIWEWLLRCLLGAFQLNADLLITRLKYNLPLLPGVIGVNVTACVYQSDRQPSSAEGKQDTGLSSLSAASQHDAVVDSILNDHHEATVAADASFWLSGYNKRRSTAPASETLSQELPSVRRTSPSDRDMANRRSRCSPVHYQTAARCNQVLHFTLIQALSQDASANATTLAIWEWLLCWLLGTFQLTADLPALTSVLGVNETPCLEGPENRSSPARSSASFSASTSCYGATDAILMDLHSAAADACAFLLGQRVQRAQGHIASVRDAQEALNDVRSLLFRRTKTLALAGKLEYRWPLGRDARMRCLGYELKTGEKAQLRTMVASTADSGLFCARVRLGTSSPESDLFLGCLEQDRSRRHCSILA